jgi:hypothetical protein
MMCVPECGPMNIMQANTVLLRGMIETEEAWLANLKARRAGCAGKSYAKVIDKLTSEAASRVDGYRLKFAEITATRSQASLVGH